MLQGGFGTVLLVRQRSDNELYALKEISKRTIQSTAHGERVLAESEVSPRIASCHGLRFLGNRFLCRLHGIAQRMR